MEDIITIVGPRSTGKSTIGKAMAKYLDWEFIDLDMYMNNVLKDEGGLVKYAEKYGRDKYLQKLNKELIVLIDSLKNKKVVLDCGGGTVASEFPESQLNAKLLSDKSKILLILPDENEEEGLKLLFEREKNRSHGLFKDWSDEKLMEKTRKDYFERVPKMKEFAHTILHVNKRTPKQMAEYIMSNIKK